MKAAIRGNSSVSGRFNVNCGRTGGIPRMTVQAEQRKVQNNKAWQKPGFVYLLSDRLCFSDHKPIMPVSINDGGFRQISIRSNHEITATSRSCQCRLTMAVFNKKSLSSVGYNQLCETFTD